MLIIRFQLIHYLCSLCLIFRQSSADHDQSRAILRNAVVYRIHQINLIMVTELFQIGLPCLKIFNVALCQQKRFPLLAFLGIVFLISFTMALFLLSLPVTELCQKIAQFILNRILHLLCDMFIDLLRQPDRFGDSVEILD